MLHGEYTDIHQQRGPLNMMNLYQKTKHVNPLGVVTTKILPALKRAGEIQAINSKSLRVRRSEIDRFIKPRHKTGE